MTEELQNSKWQGAGFPDIDFHPVRRAASALYDALEERNIFSPSTMPPEPEQFARRVVGSSHWNHAFDVAMSNVLPQYYNHGKWSGRISDLNDMLWTWDDMQEAIVDDTEWTLSDYTNRDLDMVLPTVNWANARREALQRLKWLNISPYHAQTAHVDRYRITLEHGTVVPSYQEQLAMLQATQPYYSGEESVENYRTGVEVDFLAAGNRVGIGTDYYTIEAEIIQIPKVTFQTAWKKNVMLKYTYERYGGYRGQPQFQWDKNVWFDDVFYENKDSHEVLLTLDASGNFPSNTFQNISIVNPELMPGGDILLGQKIHAYDFIGNSLLNMFMDMSSEFQYESY